MWRWLLFSLHWKLGPPVQCSVCRTLWRDCQSQFRRCTWKTTILHLEVRKTTVFCPLFFINLGQTCAKSVFVWFLLISPSRKSTLIVFFFLNYFGKSCATSSFNWILLILSSGKSILKEFHNVITSSSVNWCCWEEKKWIFLFQIFAHLLIYGFFLFLLLLFLFLLLILVLFRLVKSNRRNEVPAKFFWKKETSERAEL